jgi:MYXO-CTERM domain-containing protein
MSGFLMKFATLLFTAALFCAAQPAAGQESFQGVPQRGSAPHPSLYSFSDLQRLAVAGPAAGFAIVPTNDAPIRTAVVQPAAQFSVSEASEPPPWLLLLSGIALAVWVARRRLGYAF